MGVRLSRQHYCPLSQFRAVSESYLPLTPVALPRKTTNLVDCHGPPSVLLEHCGVLRPNKRLRPLAFVRRVELKHDTNRKLRMCRSIDKDPTITECLLKVAETWQHPRDQTMIYRRYGSHPEAEPVFRCSTTASTTIVLIR